MAEKAPAAGEKRPAPEGSRGLPKLQDAFPGHRRVQVRGLGEAGAKYNGMYGLVLFPQFGKTGDVRWMTLIYPDEYKLLKRENLFEDPIPIEPIGPLFISNLEKKQGEFEDDEEALAEANKMVGMITSDTVELYFLTGTKAYRQPNETPNEIEAENERLDLLGEPHLKDKTNLSINVWVDGDALFAFGQTLKGVPGLGLGPPAALLETEVYTAFGQTVPTFIASQPPNAPWHAITANHIHAHPWALKYTRPEDEPACVRYHLKGISIGRFVTSAQPAPWAVHGFVGGVNFKPTAAVADSLREAEWVNFVQQNTMQLVALMEHPDEPYE